MTLPFDGAISRYYEKDAPDAVRKAVRDGDDKDILDPTFPYDRWMKKAKYEEEMEPVYMASHLKAFKKTVQEGLFNVSWFVACCWLGPRDDDDDNQDWLWAGNHHFTNQTQTTPTPHTNAQHHTTAGGGGRQHQPPPRALHRVLVLRLGHGLQGLRRGAAQRRAGPSWLVVLWKYVWM